MEKVNNHRFIGNENHKNINQFSRDQLKSNTLPNQVYNKNDFHLKFPFSRYCNNNINANPTYETENENFNNFYQNGFQTLPNFNQQMNQSFCVQRKEFSSQKNLPTYQFNNMVHRTPQENLPIYNHPGIDYSNCSNMSYINYNQNGFNTQQNFNVNKNMNLPFQNNNLYPNFDGGYSQVQNNKNLNLQITACEKPQLNQTVINNQYLSPKRVTFHMQNTHFPRKSNFLNPRIISKENSELQSSIKTNTSSASNNSKEIEVLPKNQIKILDDGVSIIQVPQSKYLIKKTTNKFNLSVNNKSIKSNQTNDSSIKLDNFISRSMRTEENPEKSEENSRSSSIESFGQDTKLIIESKSRRQTQPILNEFISKALAKIDYNNSNKITINIRISEENEKEIIFDKNNKNIDKVIENFLDENNLDSRLSKVIKNQAENAIKFSEELENSEVTKVIKGLLECVKNIEHENEKEVIFDNVNENDLKLNHIFKVRRRNSS